MLLIEPLTQDTTIYEKYQYLNSGRDPILELGTDELGYRKRILIDFNLDNVHSRSVDYGATGVSKIYLNLKNATVEDATRHSITYRIGKLTDDFTEGYDKYNDYKDYYHADTSSITGATWIYKSTGDEWTALGADFIDGDTTEFEIDNTEPNISVNFLSTYASLKAQYGSTGGLSNVILYTTESFETKLGSYKYYSKETNSEKNPYFDYYISIAAKETLTTGSLTHIDLADSPILYSYNNPYEIREGDVHRFRVKCRQQFPSVNLYTTASILSTGNLINAVLYYRINNVSDNYEFVPIRSSGTLVYTDSVGYYFYIDTTNFPKDKVYSIDLRVKEHDGSYNLTYNEKLYNNVIEFKIIE